MDIGKVYCDFSHEISLKNKTLIAENGMSEENDPKKAKIVFNYFNEKTRLIIEKGIILEDEFPPFNITLKFSIGLAGIVYELHAENADIIDDESLILIKKFVDRVIEELGFDNLSIDVVDAWIGL